jgi:hypothetical protein
VTFKEVLAHVIGWLQQDQRISYRALKRQFALDDDYLEDLKAEIIQAKQVARDEEGVVLIWTGGVTRCHHLYPGRPVPSHPRSSLPRLTPNAASSPCYSVT